MAQKSDGTSGAWPFMVAAGAAGLSTLPFLLLWERLPEPIAVHWSASGAPDGSVPKLGFILFNWAMLALFCGVAGRRGSTNGATVSDAGPLFVMAGGGMLIPSVACMCVALNLDRASWSQAAPLHWSALGILLLPSLLALAVGFAARALQGRHTPRGGGSSGADEPPVVSRLTSDTDDTAANAGANLQWKASAANPWVVPWVVLMLAAIICLVVRGAFIAALIQLPAVIVLELLSVIRVHVDANEVVIRYGHLGIIRQRLRMSRVGGASATELSAWSPCGWGYRGSLSLLKHAAVIVRSGPALRLDLDGNRWLLITVDDAEQGSKIVNQLRGTAPILS